MLFSGNNALGNHICFCIQEGREVLIKHFQIPLFGGRIKGVWSRLGSGKQQLMSPDYFFKKMENIEILSIFLDN